MLLTFFFLSMLLYRDKLNDRCLSKLARIEMHIDLTGMLCVLFVNEDRSG